jgi:hypothetical protein
LLSRPSLPVGGSNPAALASPPPYIAIQLDGEYEEDATMFDIDHSDDQARLLYLAPPAKHYGFRILFAHLKLSLRNTLEVHREYKEYYNECNGEDFDLTSGKLSISSTWAVKEPDGTVTKRADSAVKLLDDSVKGDSPENILNYQIDIESGENLDVEIQDQSVSLAPFLQQSSW